MRSDDATTLGDVAFNLALQHIRDKGMPHMAEAVRDICVENETLHARIATLAAEVERVKEELGLAHECFGMVRDALTQMTGRSHDDVPPMCLDDAVRNALSVLDATRGET